MLESESEGGQPVVGHLSVISAPISISFHPIPHLPLSIFIMRFSSFSSLYYNLPDYLLVGME